MPSRDIPNTELQLPKARKLVSDIVLIWGRKGEDCKVYLSSYLVFKIALCREHQDSEQVTCPRSHS